MNVLEALVNHEILNRADARKVLIDISRGEFNDAQIAALLLVYRMRSITVEELIGFRQALQELSAPVPFYREEMIDVCGTGGDHKNTFNISTTSAFVIAGAGYRVCKHGNYGVSSLCGSSNVLEHLGYPLFSDSDNLNKLMDETGMVVLHAPFFHPAMKTVAPLRRALGMRTFFNMLGPLVNPAQPKYQMVGVYNLDLARKYEYIFQQSSTDAGSAKRYLIAHSLDGYDEISLTGLFRILRNDKSEFKRPQDIGLQEWRAEDLYGGNTVEESGHILMNILENKGSAAQVETVIANAGAAISTIGHCSLIEGIEQARESIKSGKALEVLIKSRSLNA